MDNATAGASGMEGQTVACREDEHRIVHRRHGLTVVQDTVAAVVVRLAVVGEALRVGDDHHRQRVACDIECTGIE